MNALIRSLAALSIALGLGVATPAIAASDASHATLVDQRGHAFRIADLRGKPVVVTFVATRCTDGCPIANAAFAALQRRLKRDHVAATLLTVTLDPYHDSPMAMARLASNFEADPARWRLASGAPANVLAVMQAFDVTAEPGPDGIPEQHSSFVYIVDKHGALSRTMLLSPDLGDAVEKVLK